MNIGTEHIHCSLNNNAWTVAVASLPGIEYSAVKNDDCNLPMNDNTFTVTFNLTESLIDEEINCQSHPANAFSDSSLSIQQVICK